MTPSSRIALIQRWLHRNLFSTWYNTVLTVLCVLTITWISIHLVRWIITQAQWIVVTSNLRLFLIGRYPPDQAWRIGLAGAIVLGAIALWRWNHHSASRSQKAHPPASPMVFVLPIALLALSVLIGGGIGLPRVPSNLWGGLMLTLIVASTSTVLGFPFGVLLALGRQSQLPILRGFSTIYIELVRGLPLIGILFMAQVMLPLVLPGQPNIDRVVRAIAGLVFFNAAYLAENVRGGLQAIPNGQIEAATALGLNTPLTLLLVVLPQALRIAIPGIVGQFISLFKDTSLLALFALVELTGIGRSILAQPQFLGRYAEVYLFIGLIYWSFCYTLSMVSRRLERSGAGRS
jgi:general L-amino acid transport system permease protein